MNSRCTKNFEIFKGGASDEHEFQRSIDAGLDALSASVAKLRRLAEQMGREIEEQNQMLARMCYCSTVQ
jgi:hypothetical protein